MKKDLNWLKDIKIAHRGLHNNKEGIPENTIIAIDKAIKENVAIEIDIHLLKDNTIIVFHDDTLKRSCNIDKPIKEYTYKELSKFKIFNSEYKIPSLLDVLDYVDGKVPIIIEIKNDVKASIICPILKNILNTYKGKYAIKSFNPFVCLWLKNNLPHIPRGILVSDFKKEKHFKLLKQIFLSNMLFNNICKPDFISINYNILKKKKVKKLKEKGIIILAWTFKNKLDIIKYESYYDSYIYEDKDD